MPSIVEGHHSVEKRFGQLRMRSSGQAIKQTRESGSA